MKTCQGLDPMAANTISTRVGFHESGAVKKMRRFAWLLALPIVGFLAAAVPVPVFAQDSEVPVNFDSLLATLPEIPPDPPAEVPPPVPAEQEFSPFWQPPADAGQLETPPEGLLLLPPPAAQPAPAAPEEALPPPPPAPEPEPVFSDGPSPVVIPLSEPPPPADPNVAPVVEEVALPVLNPADIQPLSDEDQALAENPPVPAEAAPPPVTDPPPPPPGNHPPTLEVPAAVAVDEGAVLHFIVLASDEDAGQMVSVQNSALPAGASFDGTTFAWTPDYTQSGTYVINYLALDSGNPPLTSAQVSVTITVNDVNRPPVANAGSDQEMRLGLKKSLVILDGSQSSDPDNDALTYTWTQVQDGAPEAGLKTSLGSAVATVFFSESGVYTFALVVKDGQADSAPDQVVVRVHPANQAPVANAGPDRQIEATGPGNTSVTLDGRGSSDPDGDQVTYTWFENNTAIAGPLADPTAAVELALGTHTITLVVNDGQVDNLTPSGNPEASDETVVVEVVDTTPPALTAPVAVTLEATSAGGATKALDPPKATDAVGPVAVTNSWPTINFPLGTTSVTWTATDGAGNSSTAKQLVLVQDTVAPVVTAPANVTAEATGSQTSVALGTATASDTVGVVSLVSDAPATFPVGATTVTWTAKDVAGNTGTAQQTITITDHTAPVVTAPANVTAEATGPAGAAVTLALPKATDNVGVVSLTSNAPGTFPLGTTAVIWTAKDAVGNTGTATQQVTVKDSTPPAVTAPPAISLEATGPQTPVALGMATATDAVGVVAISNNAPASFSLGTTTVTWTATDAAGNLGTATQLVTVSDHTAPAVTAALTAISRSRDEDEDEDGNFYRITATATDLVDPRPVVTAQITQPLTSSTSMTVSYKREKKNRIQIQTEKKKLVVQLEGPSEQALRSLWSQVLSTGGFGVSDGQQVQLVLKKDKKDEYEAKYKFDGNLKLTSAKGPGLSLVVSARDASNNQSPPAKVVPSKSGAAKMVSDGSLPTTFSLESNYPNPFNPATTLRYNLVEARLVQLTVYNVMGQQIRVLIDQVQEAGGYQVEWDATDASGQRVAPGLYLYRLVAGDQAAVGKMLLLK